MWRYIYIYISYLRYAYIYISRTWYDLNGVSENGGHRPFFMADFFGGNGADLPNGPMLIYKSQNFRSLVGMMVTLW